MVLGLVQRFDCEDEGRAFYWMDFKGVLECKAMKTLLNELYEDLDAELQKSPDLRVQQLIDLDEDLSESIKGFEGKLSQDQMVAWDAVRVDIEKLRQYARLSKLRLLMSDDEMKARIEGFGNSLPEDDEFHEAAVEIEKEMHKPSGITDVFKALLMWKDSPEEKIAKKD